ncbi:hypothetical protein AB0H73_39955 [Streptomyces olivoreticuli]
MTAGCFLVPSSRPTKPRSATAPRPRSRPHQLTETKHTARTAQEEAAGLREARERAEQQAREVEAELETACKTVEDLGQQLTKAQDTEQGRATAQQAPDEVPEQARAQLVTAQPAAPQQPKARGVVQKRHRRRR